MTMKQPLGPKERAAVIALIYGAWKAAADTRLLTCSKSRRNPMSDDYHDIRADIEKAMDTFECVSGAYLKHFRVKPEAPQISRLADDTQMVGYSEMLAVSENFASAARETIVAIESFYEPTKIYVKEQAQFLRGLRDVQCKVFEYIAERRCGGETEYERLCDYENTQRRKCAELRTLHLAHFQNKLNT